MRTLYRHARLYAPGPPAVALLVDGATIAWTGGDEAAAALAGEVERVVDCDGGFLAPAFVDAHVHVTATGLALTGPDLRSCRNAADLLDAVAHAAATTGGVVLGDGWDDSTWDDPRLPTAAELDRAAGGRPVYLARVDAHSALASRALLSVAGLSVDGLSVDGHGDRAWVRLEDHHAVRQAAFASIDADQRRQAQLAALHRAAATGIAAVHEMNGPEIAGEQDLRELLDLVGGEQGAGLPEVVPYWGELGGIETALALGAVGAAGDLFCDGSLGSHTAALHTPYADEPDRRGDLRYDADRIAEHVAACTRAGLQAGFHAIGEAAVDAVLTGIERAAAELGEAVTAAGHRLEHAEMVTDPARFARCGLTASVQPAFDATWGGRDGMYAQRLGADRAARLNDLAALSGAGVRLALGSDSPVTALDPWAAVRAASRPHEPGSAISARAAFAAHTRGGWFAGRSGDDGAGTLQPGAPATFAVWETGELTVEAPDERVSRWSTDPRAGVAGLPDLAPDTELPRCRLTVRAGRVLFDAGS